MRKQFWVEVVKMSIAFLIGYGISTWQYAELGIATLMIYAFARVLDEMKKKR